MMALKGQIDCIICAYPIDGVERMVGFGSCNHDNICSICYYRMRSIQKNLSCPNCKTELDVIICTDPVNPKRFHDYDNWGNSIGSDFIFDEKSRMYFAHVYHSSKIVPLNSIKCLICSATRRDIKSLRGHLSNEHNLTLCGLCIDHKQSFFCEFKCYTQNDYDKHLRSGDSDGSKGHPQCLFCRQRYYDVSMLFHHLTKDHYSCFICERNGLKFKYYNAYNELESHFRKSHFICEEKLCLDKRFIVFKNEIDLMSHQRQWHPTMQVRNTIPLHFNVRRTTEIESSEGKIKVSSDAQNDESMDNNNSNNKKYNRFDGGIGGRVIDGEWQVEFPSTVSDPRGDNRTVQVASDFNVMTGNDVMDYSAMLMEGSDQSTEILEDFPALPTTNVPGASISNNRWVSIRGGTGDSVKGSLASKVKNVKSKTEDYPALSTKNTSSKNNNLKNAKIAVSNDLKSITSAISINDDASSTSYLKNNEINIMEGWGRIKVDKRLENNKSLKNKSKQNNNNNDILIPQEEFPQLGNGSSKNGKIINDSFTQENIDLATAIAASMNDVPTPAPNDTPNDSELYSQVPRPPNYLNSNINADELLNPKAFPTLSMTSDLSEKSSKSSKSSKNQKSLINNNTNNKSDWSDALKSLGVSTSSSKKKSSTGLSIVRSTINNDIKISNNKISQSGSSSATPGIDLDALKPIGKLSNDLGIGVPPGLQTLNSSKSSTFNGNNEENKSIKASIGWVKLGGAERDDNNDKQNVNQINNNLFDNTKDFPSLLSNSNKIMKKNR
eukprot:gene14322-19211_t